MQRRLFYRTQILTGLSLIAVFLLLLNRASGQGRFVAIASGAWNAPATWQLVQGSDAGGNGFPDGLDSALIQSTTPGTLAVSVNATVSVSTLIIQGGTVSDGDHDVSVGTGVTFTIGAGGLSLLEGNANARRARFLTNQATSTVVVLGPLVLQGTTAARTVLSFTSSTLELQGNANFNSGNSTVSSTGGVLRFAGGEEQTLTGTLSVANLRIQKTNANPVNAGGAITVSSSTLISGTSRLNLGSTTGHNLGGVSGVTAQGTGTLMLSAPANGTTVFPGGTYTNFLAPSGVGTVEYTGSDSLLIGGIPTGRLYHNLLITGSGVKTILVPTEVQNNLTVSTEARLRSRGVTTEIRSGNLIVNGDLDFSSTTGAVVMFSGAAAGQAIQGIGQTRFRDLYLNKTGQVLGLQQTIQVLGALLWQSDGILELNNRDLILGQDAILQKFGDWDSTCMIRQDGTSGPGSLIRRGTTAAHFRMYYPIGTGTRFTPVDLTTLVATIAPGDTAQVAIKSIPFASSQPNTLRRYWRINTLRIGSISDARLVFYFHPADRNGSPDYVTRTANLIANAVPSAFIATDRFGVNSGGNTHLEEEWGLIASTSVPKTYYSFQNGNWSSPSSWTQDPSGATWINPPSGGGPNNQDRVFILPNDTIRMDVNNRLVGGIRLQHQSMLNLLSSTGHSFGQIGGRGHIRIASLNLPSGDYSDFVAADSGTFEYNLSSSFTLPASMPSYCNLILQLSDTANTATLLHNQAVNGSLTIGRGVLLIGNAANTARLSLAISQDLTVGLNGRIRVGTGNTHSLGLTGVPTSAGQYYLIYHGVSIGRHFTNLGRVRFTNQSQPVLNQNTLTGAATVFLNGSQNGTVTLSGPTDFQMLVVDKNSFTTQVDLTSANATFFRLFGRVDLPNIGTTGDPEVRKSLVLNQGALRLMGQVLIPTLTEAQGSVVGTASPANYGPHYTIPNRSHLILDGADVRVFITADNQSQTQVGALQAANLTVWTGGDEGIMLQGSLTVNEGSLVGRNGAGILYRPTGSNRGFTQNNGSVRLTQFRHFVTTGNFLFTQNNGTFEIVGSGFGGAGYSTGQAAFALSGSGHSFYQNGGTILLSGARASAAGNNPFILDIQSGTSASTGGLIDFAPDSTWSFGTRIYEFGTSGNSRLFNVRIRRVNGSVIVRARGQVTLNGSLSIEANANLQMRNNVLNIGRDFTLNGGFFHHTDPVTSGATALRFRAVPAGTAQNMVVNSGATFDFSNLELRPWTPNPVGNVLLVSGTLPAQAFTVRNFRFYDGSTFNDGGFAITISEDLETWGAPTHIGTGRLIFNNTRGTVFRIWGNATYQNIELNDPDGYQLMNSTFLVNGHVNFVSNSVFNLDVYEFRFNASATLSIPSPGDSKMFQHSGSNTQGGIRRVFSPTGGTFTYHIGTAGRYRPTTVGFTSTVTRELLVRPIPGEHPNTTFSGKSIRYHWRYFFSSLSGVSNLSFRCDYRDSDIPSNQTDNNYRVGRWVGNGWVVTNYGNQPDNYLTLNLANSSGNFDLTAGGDSAFMPISINTYVSRQTGDWHVANTWRIINGVTNAVIQDPATSIPTAVNPVRIAATHTVTVNENTPIDIPSLQIAGNSTVDFRNTCDFVVHTVGNVAVTGLSSTNVARIRLTTSSSDSLQFPGGNWSPFLNNGQANVFVQFYFSGTNYRIPNYSQLQQNQLANFAGLEVDHGTGQIQLPNQSIWANSFRVFSSSGSGGMCFNSPETAIREIRVSNAWTIGANGHFRFSARPGMLRRDHGINSNSAACTLAVASTGRMDVEPNTTNYLQYLWFNEGFTNDGTIDLQPLTVSNSRVWMCVSGGRATRFSGSGTTRVPRLYIDRGSRTNTVENQNAGFTFASVPSGSELGLQLVVGTYIQNHPNHNWLIKTGNNPSEFAINANSHLIIRAGTAFLNATGSGAGLRVDGRLTVDGTGKLRLASTNGVDNYLGVGTAGAFVTIATSDSVIVGSQFKGLGMVAAPNFTMRSGLLLIGRQGAPDLTRGMFAVAGTHSRFKVSGGRIVVMRSVGQPSVFDVNIQPDSTPVYTGGSFQVGSASMPANSNFLVQNTHGFFHLRVFNPGSLSPVLDNRNFAMTVFGNDTIDAGATQLMNNFDLNLRGNLVKNGTLTGGTGTLRFNGSGSTQTLVGTGSHTCQNLVLANTNGSGSVISIQIPVQVNNDLTISNLNELSLTSETLTVLRNVSNNFRVTTTGGRLLLAGSVRQTLTGTANSEFGRTEFANSAGFEVMRAFNFSQDMVLTQGIVDISLNRITLSASAGISGTGFGLSKYIRVSGTLSDGGIRKLFSSGAQSILVPIGMSPAIGVNKYTPAFFNIQQNTASSSFITLRVINDKHPNTLSSSNAELRYYWKVDTVGFANLRVNTWFQYDQTDANTRGNENDYEAARFGPNSVWAAGPVLGSVNAGTNTITFDGGSVGYVTFLSGDFTAGEPDEFIPLVPFLTNGTGGGNWDVASTWALNQIPPVNSAIRVVGTDVLVVSTNGKDVTNTIIDETATLDLGTTNGHDLGTIRGRGRLALASDQLPAGNYASFTQAGGGTIEYRGSVTLPLTRVLYNNLHINVPGGTVNIPNASITCNGSLRVMAGTLNNLTNRRTTVFGILRIDDGATFVAGNSASNEQLRLGSHLIVDGNLTSGNTRFVMINANAQQIGGIRASNLNYLEISKSANDVRLTQHLQVQTQIAFNSGDLVLGNFDLTLSPTTQLSSPDANSYVQAHENGKIIRRIATLPLSPAYALFPVGDAMGYKPITVQLNAGVPGPSARLEVNFSPEEHPSLYIDAARYLPVYWTVEPQDMTGPFSYDVQFTTGSHSDLIIRRPSHPGAIQAYKWNSTEGWLKGGSYDESTAMFSWSGLTTFSDFSGGTQLEEEPLPLRLLSWNARYSAGDGAVLCTWSTASERRLNGFEVQRQVPGGRFETLGFVKAKSNLDPTVQNHTYSFEDPNPGKGRRVYRLRQVDWDGTVYYSEPVLIHREDPFSLTVFPNPTRNASVQIESEGMDGTVQWTVSDVQGRVLGQGLEDGSKGHFHLDVFRQFSPGVYLLQLVSDRGTASHRITVQ